LRLGRDPRTNNLVFRDDAQSGSISKSHCELRYDRTRSMFVLMDSGSSNGTFLATGQRLVPFVGADLRAGDCFYLAQRSTMFQVDSK